MNKGWKFPRVVDSTIRSDFVSCATKGYYSFIRKLGSKDPSIDLIAGGAFAKGLEVVRGLFYSEDSDVRGNLAKSLEAGMMAAIEEYTRELGANEVPEHKAQKGPDRVVTALAAYFDKWHPAVDHIQPAFLNGRPQVEYTFSVPLPLLHPETKEPLLYAGRFDLVGMYNGQLVGVDEKTTSQLGATWVNQWNLRGQFTGYCWALRQFQFPAVGMIVRGVSFLKQTKSNPVGHEFSESIQMRAEWQIEAWYQQLLQDIHRMLLAYESGWYDQAFGDACSAYTGCPFQRLCTSHDPENWIEGYYGMRDWDPLKKVPYKQPEVATEQVQLDDDLLSKFSGRF